MTEPTIEINVSFYESKKENEPENNAFIVREVIETTLKPGENFIAVYPQVFTQRNNVDKLTGEIDRIENFYTVQDLGEIKTIPWLEPIYLQKEIEGDEADYYKLELTDESVCSLTLEELTKNANFQILDNDGKTILFSQGTRTTDKIESALEVGYYYVRFIRSDSGWLTLEYDDDLEILDDVTDANLEKEVIRDYDKCELTDGSDFSLTWKVLENDANLTILDNDGNAIPSSQEPTTTDADIFYFCFDFKIEKLAIKNYVIQVYPPEKTSTKYLLTTKKFNGFEQMVYR